MGGLFGRRIEEEREEVNNDATYAQTALGLGDTVLGRSITNAYATGPASNLLSVGAKAASPTLCMCSARSRT